MHRPSPIETRLAAELAEARPDLADRYTAELPGARAAVLTRLWRALAHEPLPWVARRVRGAHSLALGLADGRTLHGPRADPYATGGYVSAVRLDRVAYDDPARLMSDLGWPHSDGFAAELGHSVASLALSRADREFPPRSCRTATGSGSSGSSTGIRFTPTAVPGPVSRWRSSWRTVRSTGRWCGWRRFRSRPGSIC